VFTTTKFERLTRTLAASYNLPDLRIVVAPHPLGGTEATTIVQWAEGLVDDVLEQIIRT
jgi:hypothetical protein